jgi:hypothetical protein
VSDTRSNRGSSGSSAAGAATTAPISPAPRGSSTRQHGPDQDQLLRPGRPDHIMKAFAEGADGVLIAGCHPGDCHYINGNYRTAGRLPAHQEDAGAARARARPCPARVGLGRRGRQVRPRRQRVHRGDPRARAPGLEGRRRRPRQRRDLPRRRRRAARAHTPPQEAVPA